MKILTAKLRTDQDIIGYGIFKKGTALRVIQNGEKIFTTISGNVFFEIENKLLCEFKQIEV